MAASVLTFTIQAGTSGHTIAQLVANRLGYTYLEEGIVLRAARLAGVSPAVIEKSERWPSFGERLIHGLSSMRRDDVSSVGADAKQDDLEITLNPRYYHFFVDRVVLQAAHAGNCVLVGHSAQATLKGRGACVCGVLLYGDLEIRAAHVARQERIKLDEARSRLRHLDDEQSEFLKHAYQANWLDPSLYRLMVNTDDLSDMEAANLIVQMATAAGDPTDRGCLEEPRRSLSRPTFDATRELVPHLPLAKMATPETS